ncbi:MAG: Gfo/Idh/MocA family oxidoreductase [Caldilineaceae bacterium]|nr:Gfo/Idh/MocA family oxidoreductase [Caldilineaceae bacterium]
MKRIGIIGAGAIARVHAERWKQMPGVELAGYYDILPDAAQRAVDQYGGRVFGSMDEMFAYVDAVDICTTAVAHKEAVLAGAAAGVPMVCEKPLARHLSDCYEMVEAVERTGTPLFVAQVVRFFPQYAKAKETLESGALGKPAVIRTVRGGSMPRAGSTFHSGYYADFNQSGGVILDVSIHDIDYVRWCFGEVERVFARGLMFAGLPKDHTLITLRFENGAIGHIEGSWAFPPNKFRTRVEIAGTDGLLEWDSLDRNPLEMTLHDPEVGPDVTTSSASPLATADDPYYAELSHFVDALDRKKPFLVTPYDGLMAVKISLAAIESERRGEPVRIRDFNA